MKKAALFLMLLWSYLLVVSYYGLDSYSGAAMRNLGAWQLMLVSALIVPIVALGVVSFVKPNSDNNETTLKFISLNIKQLKAYGIGALLLIVLVGGLIMVGAALCGIFINVFFFATALVKRNG